MLQEKLGHKSTGRLLIHWCNDWIAADLRRSPLKVNVASGLWKETPRFCDCNIDHEHKHDFVQQSKSAH